MEKKKKLWILAGVLFVFILANAYAETAKQDVSVLVLPGMGDIEIHSPTDGGLYQTNFVLLNISVTTSIDKVKEIWLLEGKDSKILCSRRKDYAKEFNFPEGEHELLLRVNFENNVAERKVKFTVDTKSNLYIVENKTIRIASKNDILEYLFNHNFTIERKTEIIPGDSCGIRARDGKAVVRYSDFGNNSYVNAYYSSVGEGQGQGELAVQNDRNRIAFTFKLERIEEKTPSKLSFLYSGNGNLGTSRVQNEKILITVENSSVSVKGISPIQFSIDSFSQTSLDGCKNQEKTFYFLMDNGMLENSIESVRTVLKKNPILIERFNGLGILFKIYWRMIFLGF